MTNPIKNLPEIIKTPRLEMRRLDASPENAALIFSAVKHENPDDFYFNPIGMENAVPMDVDEMLRRMQHTENYAGDNGAYYYVFENGQPIGLRRFYFFDEDARRTFQMSEVWFVRSVWGRGFARETYAALEKIAFETLGANRITRQCSTENIRSANSIRASGFHLDGISRGGGVYQDGKIYDNMMWSKLKNEYNTSSQATVNISA